MSETVRSRREFIKTATKTTAAAAAAGVVLAGCMNDKKAVTTNVSKGVSSKSEILYRQTADWDIFYKSC